MKALMCPIEPRTTMSTPFIEMPQRAAASPWTTRSPPRPVAPADWLAGDRVAEDGEAVGGPDEERVEAVEVVEAALERVLERRAFPQAPGEIGRGDLGVVLGLELHALPPELTPQAVVIRERAVVHEAEIAPSRERMRPGRRDATLRRHARVPEPV